ncbi:MAG: hypothetical protein N3G20_05975, partial [Verrucomicrobiae bacterium]|nr:hypothetical protein [Verrucomicrobiae bacterium]
VREEDESGTVVQWQYDVLGRLVRETVTPTNGTPEVVSYEYDAAGNCIKRTDSSGTTTLTYDADSRLISAGTDRFFWDENGNLVRREGADGIETFEYDAFGRLTRFTSTSGETTSYVYDHHGNRVAKVTSAGEVRYLVDEVNPTGLPQILAEFTPSGSNLASYVYGPWLISEKRVGGKRFAVKEGRFGSVRRAVLSSGTVDASFNYSAFGKWRSGTGVRLTHGFAGEVTDLESGFVYMRARYYAPRVGRFFTPDPAWPAPGTATALNPYLYAGCDPVNAGDPLGLYTYSDIAVANSIRNIFLRIYTQIAMDVFSFALSMKSGKTFDQAMEEYRINQDIGFLMFFLPAAARTGTAIIKGSIERCVLYRANAAAMYIHKMLMRSLGFTRHDWSKCWLWCWFNATKGQDAMTKLSIRIHNALEAGHHVGSTPAELREKCFDVVLAGCEAWRNPLMPRPRQAPEALKKTWDAMKAAGTPEKHWLFGEIRKKFRLPPHVSQETFHRLITSYIDEAVNHALDVTDLLTFQNPFGVMPQWFVKTMPVLESIQRSINDVGVGEMIRAMQVYLGFDLLHKGTFATPPPSGTAPPTTP